MEGGTPPLQQQQQQLPPRLGGVPPLNCSSISVFDAAGGYSSPYGSSIKGGGYPPPAVIPIHPISHTAKISTAGRPEKNELKIKTCKNVEHGQEAIFDMFIFLFVYFTFLADRAGLQFPFYFTRRINFRFSHAPPYPLCAEWPTHPDSPGIIDRL